MQREAAGAARPDAARRAAFTAMATRGATATTALLFLGIALRAPWSFTETGIALALAALAVSSMPLKPLPRPTAVALAAFGLHYGYATGLLGVALLALGAAAGTSAYVLAAWRNRWIDISGEPEAEPALT